MKLLLTSAGIKNASIHDALVDLLGKPISESSALCIPTAMYGHPWVGPGEKAWQFISGQEPSCPMCELGWKSLGVLELTALPSIDEERWVPLVQETDVLLASGGDALYLCHWMRQSGLADLLPSLDETVWVGLSAGSMVMTPRIGDDFVGWKPPTGGDETLGIVDFSIFPHVDNEDLPSNTMANAERWAGGLSGPAYAIDDETAIKVVDGTVDVVSEGHWKLLTAPGLRLGRVSKRAFHGGGGNRTREGFPPSGESTLGQVTDISRGDPLSFTLAWSSGSRAVQTRRSHSMPNTAAEAIQLGALSVRFHVDADESGGSVSIFECEALANARMPAPHSHDDFDETVLGLDGVTTFTVGGERTSTCTQARRSSYPAA